LVLKSKTVWKPAIINELIGLAMCLAVGNTFVFYQNLELFLFNFLLLVKNTLLQTDFSAILLTGNEEKDPQKSLAHWKKRISQ